METRRSVTPAQINALINYMDNNDDLVKLKDRSQEGRNQNRRQWEECAEVVNRQPGEPRNGKEWSKYWSELKCRVKVKLANQSKAQRSDGNILTATEEAVVAIVNRHAEQIETKEKKVHNPIEIYQQIMKENSIKEEQQEEKEKENEADVSEESNSMAIDLTEDEAEEGRLFIKTDSEEDEEDPVTDKCQIPPNEFKKSPKHDPALPSTPRTTDEMFPAPAEEVLKQTNLPGGESEPSNASSRIRTSPRVAPYLPLPQARVQRLADSRAREVCQAQLEQRRLLLEQLHASVHVVWTETALLRAEGIARQADVARSQADAIATMSQALHRLVQIANKYYLRPNSANTV